MTQQVSPSALPLQPCGSFMKATAGSCMQRFGTHRASAKLPRRHSISGALTLSKPSSQRKGQALPFGVPPQFPQFTQYGTYRGTASGTPSSPWAVELLSSCDRNFLVVLTVKLV